MNKPQIFQCPECGWKGDDPYLNIWKGQYGKELNTLADGRIAARQDCPVCLDPIPVLPIAEEA